MKNQNGNANDTTPESHLLWNRSLVKHGGNNVGFGETTGEMQGYRY